MTDIEIESKTRDRAYAIWEAEGRPEGRAVDHWLAAEATRRPAAQSKARATRVRRTRSGTPDDVAAPRAARSTVGKSKTAAGAGGAR